ncbi:hypothetical protein RHGRI_035146 [Rhododendron griersonianum]|uniref:Uncharacterized protein n=1 Tax=Rhododendron griersonianum TaxID=479676 RepID=A0AAV6I3F0_9ERIC|nr:hypothetical protein RHGRI_035146 [Rhododendron griersonianum]
MDNSDVDDSQLQRRRWKFSTPKTPMQLDPVLVLIFNCQPTQLHLLLHQTRVQ